MSSFVLVSYYSLGTPYAQVAHNYLMASILGKEITTDIHGIVSLGSWQKNTSYKSTFVLKEMNLHPDKNIVFVDCDAEVKRYPDLFDNIPQEFDFAAHFLDRGAWYNQPINEKELLSGTLFVRNTPFAKEIVQKWEFECNNSKLWEQKLLQKVLEREKVPVFDLPLSYCYINSLPNGDEPFVKCNEVTILHHQVSRKYRNLK